VPTTSLAIEPWSTSALLMTRQSSPLRASDGGGVWTESGTTVAATRLLICADSGGSNGARTMAWKLHLQGVEISKKDIDQLRLKRHKLHPDRNYTLLPRP
jgi:hypothetical protein